MSQLLFDGYTFKKIKKDKIHFHLDYTKFIVNMG